MPKWVYNQTHTHWEMMMQVIPQPYIYSTAKITLKQADKQMLLYFLLYYPTWC